LTVPKLKDKLKAKGLPVSGTKQQLIEDFVLQRKRYSKRRSRARPAASNEPATKKAKGSSGAIPKHHAPVPALGVCS